MTAALLGALAGPARAGKGVLGVVNLNTAEPSTLELLPGIGPAKVQSILDYRRKHLFRTVDELVRIKGIGPKMVKHLRPHLAVNGPTTAEAARGVVEPPPPPPPPPKRPLVCPPVPVTGRSIARSPRAPPLRTAGAVANHCLHEP